MINAKVILDLRVEVDAESCWNESATISQIRKQAVDEVSKRIRDLPVRLIGNTVLSVIIQDKQS